MEEKVYGVIYGIENLINHKIYVGQTKCKLNRRINNHKRCQTSSIGKAIRKYGWENFLVVVLEECETPEQLNEREAYWIAKLKCKAPKGYNRTDGGDGCPGHHCSEETRLKHSLAMIGNQHGKATKGRPKSEEHKAKISAANKGKKRSPEYVARVTEFFRSIPHYVRTDADNAKISKTKRKVFYPNLDAELVRQNITYREIGRRLEIPKSTIQGKLNGSRPLDEKTALAIRKLLGLEDMPLSELFRMVGD